MTKTGIIFLSSGILLIIYSFQTQQVIQQNHPPVVKIVAPKVNNAYNWNTQVRYAISVSDKEDGESRYQEIIPNEVLLQVKYIDDTSKSSAATVPPGLQRMIRSNCLNCHAFNSKLIGPSFYEIGKKYSDNQPNTELLSKRIREGSSGIWGTEKMPTHFELTTDETHAIVKWILNNADREGTGYYLGTEGMFWIKPPSSINKKGGFVLTATYTDHGLKEDAKHSLSGQDVIVIQGQ